LDIRFTRHALNKFKLLNRYGFNLTEDSVVEAVRNPHRIDERNGQRLALMALDNVYALRVVYEERNEYYLIITFYPVRRSRFGL